MRLTFTFFELKNLLIFEVGTSVSASVSRSGPRSRSFPPRNQCRSSRYGSALSPRSIAATGAQGPTQWLCGCMNRSRQGPHTSWKADKSSLGSSNWSADRPTSQTITRQFGWQGRQPPTFLSPANTTSTTAHCPIGLSLLALCLSHHTVRANCENGDNQAHPLHHCPDRHRPRGLHCRHHVCHLSYSARRPDMVQQDL